MVLRIYFDEGVDSRIPSVEAPVGDFFAAGNGMHATVHSSLAVSVASYGRAMNCYWKMPFSRAARVEMTNDGPSSTGVFFQIDWDQGAIAPDALRFHARYRQEYPQGAPFTYYTLANISSGSGQYVGTVLSSVNNLDSWFGEGSDRWFINSEEEPSIVGTGTEDYLNDGWNLRLQQDLRRGVTIMEAPHGRIGERLTAYRWHVDDPMAFNTSLVGNIER
jgi:hypothetical protein|eukprot:COSAG06_NODE_1952_length_7992_cov_4.274294_9_plen_219_part_00